MLLVGGAHLVGGWVLANGFRRSTLRVQNPTTPEGMAVRAVSAATITLQASAPRQEIGHPGIIGLRWDSGYGQAGELIEVKDDLVTRSFEILEGSPPPVCPDLDVEDCPQVIPDSYAFPRDPSDAGLNFREVTFPSTLGPLNAWVVPGDRATWAVHVHGWTADRREAIRLLPVLHRQGMTSMVIDYRNDPGAPADPSGHYRFGLEEWLDVESAVQYALGQGAENMLCLGYSTGAAHILSFLERSRLASRVRSLVLDSPNMMLAEAVRYGFQEQRLPVLGVRTSPLLIELGMWIANLRWGVDWDQTNYVQRAESTISVPALVFHGTSDQRVPISVSRQLQARVPELVWLEETPAAGHVMSWNANPEVYESLIEGFLDGLQN